LQVVGILGSRRTSPFKSLNIDQAVKRLLGPKTTRTSDPSRDEGWLPTMEEFIGCANADEFKNLVSEEQEFPASELWERAQSFWIHPKIFEILDENLDANKPQRAGKIAIEVMKAVSAYSDNEELPEQIHQLMLFLWSIENLRASKVSTTDAPSSELFDNRAQEVMKRLDPEQRSPSRPTSRVHENEEGEKASNRSDSPGTHRREDHPPSPGESAQSQASSTKRRSRSRSRSRNKRRSRRAPTKRRGRGSPPDSSSPSSSSSPERPRPKKSRKSPSPEPSPGPRSKSRSGSRSRSVSPSISRSRSRSKSKSRSRSRSRSTSRSPTRRTRSRSRSAPSRPRSYARHNSRPGGRRDPRNDEELNSVMMKNLTAITASHLKRDAREDKKKSMLSRLAPEAAKLFDLLSARDWRDSNPRMNRFVKDLVADKDSHRASGVMFTRTKRWSGEISDKGLLNFFANGFAANDIQESPGGFTIFMFRPITAKVPKDRKDRRQQVRAMFGSTELDEEAVKYYAENDFFLPESLADLEEQIHTCIKTLELFTEQDGIAVEAFTHGFEMIQRDRRIFKNLLQADPQFAVKFAYLLDRVFQNFIDKLGNFYQVRDPIRRAKRSLKYSQSEQIKRAMIGYEVGTIPNLLLPSSLRVESKVDHIQRDPSNKKERTKEKDIPKSRADQVKKTDLPSENPGLEQDWKLPEGKRYKDYFDSRDTDGKANTIDWPKFPHHKSGVNKRLCLKYQTTGSCLSSCYLAHVDPRTMVNETKKTISDRFKAIYA
jgi:hypothetical protein